MTGVSETAHGVPIVDGAGRRALNWLRGLSGYQRLGLGTILGLLVLVVLGGTVRVTDSGLACPDWPLCYGELFPSGPYVTEEGRVFEGYQVSLEWTHRLVASVIGLVILAFVAGAWLKFRDRRWVVLPATASVVALVVQVLLGGLTVTEELDAGIVASHLGVALVIVLLILGAWLATFVPLKARPSQAEDPGMRRLARWAVGTGVATLALMVLGGYVSGTDAAFFCNTDWPLCNGSIFPAGREAQIQVSHRYVALLVGLLVLGLWALAYRRRQTQRAAFLLATVLALLYVAQALLGAATQWTTLADWSRIMHLAMGALTWVTAVILMGLLTYRVGWFPSMSQRMDLPAFFPSRLSAKGTQPGD